jgi:hypothetical protein
VLWAVRTNTKLQRARSSWSCAPSGIWEVPAVPALLLLACPTRHSCDTRRWPLRAAPRSCSAVALRFKTNQRPGPCLLFAGTAGLQELARSGTSAPWLAASCFGALPQAQALGPAHRSQVGCVAHQRRRPGGAGGAYCAQVGCGVRVRSQYVHPSQKQLFSRNGPVAASPCKGMCQWQLTIPAKGEFASKNVQICFRTILWPVLARGRPWPARFVHLSRKLTMKWWHRSWTN